MPEHELARQELVQVKHGGEEIFDVVDARSGHLDVRNDLGDGSGGDQQGSDVTEQNVLCKAKAGDGGGEWVAHLMGLQ